MGVFRGRGSSHAKAMGLIVVLVRHLLPLRVLDQIILRFIPVLCRVLRWKSMTEEIFVVLELVPLSSKQERWPK